MVSGFATCDACARHVRAQSSVCPFCQTPISAPARAAAPALARRAGPRPHLSRAAILAGAALALSGSACSSSDSPGTGTDGGGGGDDDAGLEAGMAQPVYGAPAGDGGHVGKPDGGSGGLDGAVGEPAYGAPPMTEDGGDDRDGGITQPVYGSPTPLP